MRLRVLFLSMVFVVFSLLFSSLVLFLVIVVVVVVGLGSARVLDPGYFPVRISVHILGCSFCFHLLLQLGCMRLFFESPQGKIVELLGRSSVAPFL